MAVPNPEDLYDPTVLTPQEAIEVEEVSSRKPVGVLAVGLALAAAFLVYRRIMQRRAERITAPSPQLMERALVVGLRENFAAFMPNWIKMTSPLLYAGYLAGVEQSGVRLPKAVLEQMATGYSESLGTYVHQVSSDAMLGGFRALVNRKVDHRRALLQTSSAFGVGPRTMNALVNVWTSEEPKSYTNVRRIDSVKEKRAALIAAKGIKDRAHVLGDHEAWNAKEQAKEAAWLYAMNSGLISGAATKIWHTARDERVCPSCGPLDEKKVPVDGRFDTELGRTLTPPLHVNCRCEVQLKASLRRILLGQIRKRPIKKAYEGRPWARHQQRNEEGEWVKGAGGHKLAIAHEDVEPAPPAEEKAPAPPKLSYGTRPQQKLSYSAKPQQKLSYSAQPQQKLSYQAPPQQERQAPPQQEQRQEERQEEAVKPAFKLEYPTKKKSAEAQDEKALHEYLRDKEDEAPEVQFDTEDLPKPRSGTFTRMNLDKPIYGIIYDDEDIEDLHDPTRNLRLEEVEFTDNVNELAHQVEMVVDNGVEHYLQETFEERKLVEAFTEGGRTYYADRDAVEVAFEWARAKENRRSNLDFGNESDSNFIDDYATVFLYTESGRREQRMHAVPTSKLIHEMGLDEALQEMKPTILTTKRVDADRSYLDVSYDNEEWMINGPHQVVSQTSPIADKDGQVLPVTVWEIDPVDE